MQIQLTGDNIEITPAIRDYTEKKLKRIQAHMNRITDVHITFSIEKLDQIVDAKISVPGSLLHAHAASEDIYESIDKITDKLTRQLTKYKEKLTDHS